MFTIDLCFLVAVVYVAGGVYIILNSHHISAYISVYINSEHILCSTWKVILMEQYMHAQKKLDKCAILAQEYMLNHVSSFNTLHMRCSVNFTYLFVLF